MKLLKYSMRVVAIDLTSIGYAHAILDGPRDLVDWGSTRFDADRHDRTVTAIKAKLDKYAPCVLVLEDMEAPECRKGSRVRAVACDLMKLAHAMQIRVILIRRALAQATCGGSPDANQYVMATRLVDRFPELKWRKPRKRELWDGEDYRINIFDAVAFGATAYAVGGRAKAA